MDPGGDGIGSLHWVDQAGQVKDLLKAGDIPSAVGLLANIHGAAVEAFDWAAASFAANWIGHVHEQYLKDLTGALAWFDRAETDATTSMIGLPASVATAAFNGGLVSEGRGRSTEAAGRYERAAAAAASAKNPTLEAACLERRGTLLVELGRAIDGCALLRTAGDLAHRAGAQALARRCRNGAGTALRQLEAEPATRFDRLARASINRCLATVELPDPEVILDAGCGAGAGVEALARQWPTARVFGVDDPAVASTVQLPRAIRARVTVRGADLTRPLNDLPPVDVALCHSVLHEVAKPVDVLQTVAGIIRPGGQLIGACFTTDYYARIWADLEQAGEDPPRPPFRHRPDQVEAALWAAGFTGVETWVEEVTVQIDEARAAMFLERVLRRSLQSGQFTQLRAATGHPLLLDLRPLHFRAYLPGNRRSGGPAANSVALKLFQS
jgi:SAM-dependent methyltransferase